MIAKFGFTIAPLSPPTDVEHALMSAIVPIIILKVGKGMSEGTSSTDVTGLWGRIGMGNPLPYWTLDLTLGCAK